MRGDEEEEEGPDVRRLRALGCEAVRARRIGGRPSGGVATEDREEALVQALGSCPKLLHRAT